MMACPSLRGRTAYPIANLYPTAAQRDAYRKTAVCPWHGTRVCRFCNDKRDNGGVCPDANILGLRGERR